MGTFLVSGCVLNIFLYLFQLKAGMQATVQTQLPPAFCPASGWKIRMPSMICRKRIKGEEWHTEVLRNSNFIVEPGHTFLCCLWFLEAKVGGSRKSALWLVASELLPVWPFTRPWAQCWGQGRYVAGISGCGCYRINPQTWILVSLSPLFLSLFEHQLCQALWRSLWLETAQSWGAGWTLCSPWISLAKRSYWIID